MATEYKQQFLAWALTFKIELCFLELTKLLLGPTSSIEQVELIWIRL